MFDPRKKVARILRHVRQCRQPSGYVWPGLIPAIKDVVVVSTAARTRLPPPRVRVDAGLSLIVRGAENGASLARLPPADGPKQFLGRAAHDARALTVRSGLGTRHDATDGLLAAT